MKAVNPLIIDLILQLQSIEVLKPFALAGGTNLALRYNKRLSIDIDLFTSNMVGKNGFEHISKELKKYFASSLLFCEIINTESGDQYCFLRALINNSGLNIKVELIQNIPLLKAVEIFEGIKLLSLKDLGTLKLMSGTGRKANKDIYDLDLITDEIILEDLLELLREKETRFNKEENKCLFDLDEPPSPVNNLSLLLEFDNIDYSSLPLRPSHSNDRIELMLNAKSWQMAKLSWKRKVKDLMNRKGLSYPGIKPIN
ncbi:MAG: nucleotidyl transferase AbiEii/AbiGii toxin family protein [Sphingobacteriales bacterium]|nr:nucleotidyl transferase AbiEii/AbiGii toxin family protein [Sphingobacteriales bacterium]MBI3718385.1 nucleotidyl transferase AbiEii/AbiGii toxin family protein [Sphingobacteriales bacterium]